MVTRPDCHYTDHEHRPSLTGNGTTDAALWHLSLILREISLERQGDEKQIVNPADIDSKGNGSMRERSSGKNSTITVPHTQQNNATLSRRRNGLKGSSPWPKQASCEMLIQDSPNENKGQSKQCKLTSNLNKSNC
jgi:hypothetical protein